MKSLKSHKAIHIVGIGGAGMSAIARVLSDQGIVVRGSDRQVSIMTEALRAEGIPVAIGHAAGNIVNADLVLASSAVPDSNPELLAAHQRGIEVVRRPTFLTELTKGYKVIAVAGTHGKTTVTGMIALLMMEVGMDPSFIVGGVVGALGTNARAGKGPYFVIEADEYRNTFLSLSPYIAVVTNVEHDHPDSFEELRHVRLAFGEFVDKIVPGGQLIACNDDQVAHAVAASYHANGGRLSLYGMRKGVGLDWQARDLQPNELGGMTFLALYQEVPVGLVKLRIPGAFNVLNALATLSVATELELDWVYARNALEHFTGAARRFEVLGEVGGVTVIDDYAHHPTQIRVVLQAARQRYPKSRVVAVWEPHTYSRIRALHGDFMAAFDDADMVMVLPIYAAREPEDSSMSARQLAEEVLHPEVTAATSLDEAVHLLAAECHAGDVVLLMGAGNEYVVGTHLVKALRAKS
ncbi:MAG: UDP-N-acetylmuramate--L-alanine ligase [Anaerolineae bacterium]|nr:UDP-N-acetylmuramate--L-alanine ligase [Anaerolineae bacterium]